MPNKIENHIVDQIDNKEMIGFLQKLVQSNSENPPGNEEHTAGLIAKELESFGCKTRLQYVDYNRPNIIGVLEGIHSEKLLFNGHTDTVKVGNLDNWTVNPFGAMIKNGYLYGRGACDMKAGLVSMIFAMKALKKSEIPFNKGIIFTGVIDEEVNFKGTRALIEEKILDDCKFGFVSEPTSLKIVNQHKGAIEYKAVTFGTSAHSGQAYKGINAIARMGKLIAALESYNVALAGGKKHPIFVHPTLNIGTIQGGTGITLVPEHCEIEFDRQILPGEVIDQVERQIEDIIFRVKDKHHFTAKLIKTQQFDSWNIPKNDLFVQWFKRVFKKVLKKKSFLDGLHGYCEAELLAQTGISPLVFGPGSIDKAHAPDERVLIQEVIDAAKVYAIAGYEFVSQKIRK